MSAASTGTVFSPGMLCITRLIEIGDGGAYIEDIGDGFCRLQQNDIVMVLQYADRVSSNNAMNVATLLLPRGVVGRFHMYDNELEPMATI